MMRHITLAAIGLAFLVPSVASASCFGRCHGGWSSCNGGCSGSCHGSCWGSCHGGCSASCHGGSWGSCHGGCWGSSSYRAGYGGHAANGYYYSSSSVAYSNNNGYSYSSPSGVYSSRVVDGNTMGRTSYYLDPSASLVSSKQVHMQVILPGANDDLFIEGQKMTSKGSLRVFYSPDLEPGKRYTYTVKIQRTIDSKIQEETRYVDVQTGSMTSVDFTRPNK